MIILGGIVYENLELTIVYIVKSKRETIMERQQEDFIMFLILSGIGLLWSIGCFICLIMSLIVGILTKGEFMDTARIYGKFLLVGLLVTVLGASVFHGIDSKAYEETKTTSINGIVPLEKGTEIEGKILENETYVAFFTDSGGGYLCYSLKDEEYHKERINSGKISIYEVDSAKEAKIEKCVNYVKHKNLSASFVKILTLTGGVSSSEYKIFVPSGSIHQISNIKVR